MADPSPALASMNFLDGSKIEQQRVLLAVYPLLCVTCLLLWLCALRSLDDPRLFYFILAWMILIQ
jgi:protein YIPF6